MLRWSMISSTIKGRYTRGSLLPQHAPATRSRSKAPSSAPTNSPSYQTGLIWGSKLQGQMCCTSLFQEQAPWCVLKFACRDMTCLQLANQIGLFFSSTTHCELTFIVSMPQSGCFIIQLPRRVLRVYWLGHLPRACFGGVFQEQAPSCVPAFKLWRRCPLAKSPCWQKYRIYR